MSQRKRAPRARWRASTLAATALLTLSCFAACGDGSADDASTPGGSAGTSTAGTGAFAGSGGGSIGGLGGSSGSGGDGGLGGIAGSGGTGAVAGFGGSGATAGSGGTGSVAGAPSCSKHVGVTPADACDSYATASCAVFAKCAPLALFWQTEAECRSQTRADCESTLTPETGVRPELFAAVAERYEAALSDCALLYDLLVTGQAASGDATCDGTGATLADGAQCFADAQCLDGFCDRATGAPCGVCAAWLGNGVACDATRQCAAGSYCSEQSGQCVALASVGESCAMTACASGLYCAGGTCTERASNGQPCSDVNGCQQGLICSSTGQCASPALGDVGDPCDPAEELSCNLFLSIFCDETTNQCVASPLPSIGDVCTSACAGGLSCVNQQCVTPIPNGNACTSSAQCLHLSSCIEGQCRAPAVATCP